MTAETENMTDEELRQAYNAAPKPNQYGAELLRRIHERDQQEVSRDNALRDPERIVVDADHEHDWML